MTVPLIRPLTPTTAPGGLPELVTVQCKTCSATGLYDYAVTADGDLVRLECPECLGDAVRTVCGGCGQEPEVVNGLERCSCNRLKPCELCGTPALLNAAAICATCHADGMADWQREEDERAVWVEEQLELGKAWGWL